MSESFDPYSQWLGIPSEQQPPDYYRLLGLAALESDTELIAAAAGRQAARVKQQATSGHGAVAQRILHQIAKARSTLSDPRLREQYEAQIRGGQAAASGSDSSPNAALLKSAELPPKPIATQEAAHAVVPAKAPPKRAVPLATPVPSGNPGFSLAGSSGESTASVRRRTTKRQVRWRLPAMLLVVAGLAVIGVILATSPPGGPRQPSGETGSEGLGLADASRGADDADAVSTGEPNERPAGSDESGAPDQSGTPSDTEDESDLATGETEPVQERPLDYKMREPDLVQPGPDGKDPLAGDLTPDDFPEAFTDPAENPDDDAHGENDALQPGVELDDPMDVAGPMPEAPGAEPEPKEKRDRPRRIEDAIGPVREDVPAGEDLRLAQRKVRNEFSPLPKTANERILVAGEMIEQALAATDKPALQYVLLTEARNIASDAGDLQSAWRAMNLLTEQFNLDKYRQRAELMLRFSAIAEAESHEGHLLKKNLQELLTTSLKEDRYDIAKEALTAIAGLAKRWDDADLKAVVGRHADEVKQGMAHSERVAAAKRHLQTNPGDAAANLALGEYYCFVRNDWQRGAPYLGNVGDATLMNAADLETSFPNSAATQAETGEAWLEVAKKFGRNKPQYQAAAWRGRKWLIRAWSTAKGDEKDDIEARLISTKTLVINALGMKLVLIPPGEFLMGSPPLEPGRELMKITWNGTEYTAKETQHRVRFSKPFYVGIHEVTQSQFKRLLGVNPSLVKGDEMPVHRVSWSSAVEFCEKLNRAASGGRYRLPTEAEWEYACRAETGTAYCFGDEVKPDQVNAGRDAGSFTSVGSFQPNAFGLHDMHGNAFEWVEDAFVPGYYQSFLDKGSVAVDPLAKTSMLPVAMQRSPVRIARGGSYRTNVAIARSAMRRPQDGTAPELDNGFRVVLVAQ